MATFRSINALCLVLALLLVPLPVVAQPVKPGSISGTVRDIDTGGGLSDVTVFVTPSAGGKGIEVKSNAKGFFKVSKLAPGYYSVLFIVGNASTDMPTVMVKQGENSTLFPKLKPQTTIYRVIGKRPHVDKSRSRIVKIYERETFEKLPVPGNSFEDILAMAPTAANDGQGVGFAGSSSLESSYIVDGQNTTGLSYGTIGSPISREFIQEVGVITGGYMAERGRSTGAVVEVVTRTGSNQFHGTVFSKFTNSMLQKRAERAPVQSWIDVESNLAYDLTMGATLGGPIIKDKLFFFVGIAPRLIARDTDRITKRLSDCRTRLEDGSLSACLKDENGRFLHEDTVPDIDDQGFFIYDELDRSTLRSQATEYQFVSKINYAPLPEHAGQFTFSGTPFSRQEIGVTGEPQAVSRDIQVLTTDLSAKWTSKFNDNKTVVEAIVGMHRSSFESGSIDESANEIPHERLVFGNFGKWAAGNNSRDPSQPRESLKTVEGCQDSMDITKDPYPFIENCPDTGIGYSVGGIGFLGDEEEQRTSGKITFLQRVEAAGNHQLKAGLDFEENFLNKKRLLSGEAFFTNEQGGRNRIEVFRYVALAPEGDTSGAFGDQCGRGDQDTDPVACDYTPSGDVRGRTLNLAGFLQDSWEVLPNLTFNAGLRYEEQRLRNAEHLRGTSAVGTGELLGKNAMELRNMWAPRLGLIYDWTKEAKGKVFGSWGRFYESIPMDINDRSFGGESWMRSVYDSSDLDQCGPVDQSLGGDAGTPSGAGCIASGADPAQGDRLTGAGVLVAPGTKAQFLDEAILGVEYELMEDLKLGLTFQNRRMGRVLEDLSTDNADTYVLANPGFWSREEEAKLNRQIASESDPLEQGRLRERLEQFKGIRKFDKPRRDYNSLTASVSKRFSRNLYAQSSYTYSKTEGNYQGLFSSNNGQVDPNITSLFDLPELMANRDGPLPQDRPHFFKLDGFYTFDFREAGELTTGMGLRALSGTPLNATGAHYLYGRDETMLLPRGEMGRVDFDFNANVKLGYVRKLSQGMQLEAYVDFFNVNRFGFLGGQGTASVEQRYTRSNVNPVVGGRYEDLVYLKELDNGNGAETGTPVARNRNFGNTLSPNAGPAATLTARLSF